MPRCKPANSENNTSPPNGGEYIYVLVCPISGLECYVGRTCGTLHSRLTTHMAMLTAKKQPNLKLMEWKQSVADAGLKPLIKQIELVDRMDANAAERRWTRHFQRMGRDLLNIRNVLLRESTQGFDLWELNDIADRHNLHPSDVATAANACQPSVVGFLSGAKHVTRITASNVAKFLHSLPADRLPHGKYSSLRDYADYFLDDYLKQLYSK